MNVCFFFFTSELARITKFVYTDGDSGVDDRLVWDGLGIGRGREFDKR